MGSRFVVIGCVCTSLTSFGCGTQEGSTFSGSAGTGGTARADADPSANIVLDTTPPPAGTPAPSMFVPLPTAHSDAGTRDAASIVREGCRPELVGTIRDFVQVDMPADKIPVGYMPHPDFNIPWAVNGDDRGLVLNRLGNDGKPVYAHPGGSTLTTHSQASFDQWYRDTPGVNMSASVVLALSKRNDGDEYVYDNQAFFPIDGRLLGTSWDPDNGMWADHNFHFTLELHTKFLYRGGERFSFNGDDDVFVFINNVLAIDLGGVHVAESADINLDARAAELGMTAGNEYPIAFFFNERHLYESHFKMTTTLTLCGEALPTNAPSADGGAPPVQIFIH